MTHTLYRFYDATPSLLYIGITNNPPRRLKQHEEDKSWWTQVATVQMEHFDSREKLEQAEKLAIQKERPRHNIMHNNGIRYPCDFCGKKLSKSSTHVILETGTLVCISCVLNNGRQAHNKFYPTCPHDWHDLNDHGIKHATYAAVKRMNWKVLEPTRTLDSPNSSQNEVAPTSPLVGRWFHSWREPIDEEYDIVCRGRAVVWQGQIVDRVAPETYLIQLYSWWDGTAGDQKLVPLSDMTDWTFYVNNIGMQIALGCSERCNADRTRCGNVVAYRAGPDEFPMGMVCTSCASHYSGGRPLIWRNEVPELGEQTRLWSQ